jgi:hypothetical protein
MSRRARFGWFGRDAQTDTRDACAPRTTDFDFRNVPEIFTSFRKTKLLTAARPAVAPYLELVMQAQKNGAALLRRR